MARKNRIIYFINAPAPTEKELEIANDLTDMKHSVAFRNCTGVDANDTIEAAEFYCGDIPSVYRERLLTGPKATAKEIDLETRQIKGAKHSPAVVVATSPMQAPQQQQQQETPVQTEREKHDLWAKGAKVAELKQGLTHFNIPFEPDANKAELLALFLSRP